MKYFSINELTKTSTGMPITVTSGYRSENVNKAVGGVATSTHKR